MKNTIQVEIFGNKCTIKSDADPSYTIELANFVDKKVREVAESSSAISSHKIIILAAINIANEFFQLVKRREEQDIRLDERIEGLIKLIKENQL